MSKEQQPGKRPVWLQAIVDHPYMTVFNLPCLIVGTVVAIDQLPPEWSLVRRTLSGAFSGTAIGLFITANRMLGAWR